MSSTYIHSQLNWLVKCLQSFFGWSFLLDPILFQPEKKSKHLAILHCARFQEISLLRTDRLRQKSRDLEMIISCQHRVITRHMCYAYCSWEVSACFKVLQWHGTNKCTKEKDKRNECNVWNIIAGFTQQLSSKLQTLLLCQWRPVTRLQVELRGNKNPLKYDIWNNLWVFIKHIRKWQ